MSGGIDDSALALSDITKRFGSTIALERAEMSVARGSVHALLGENGAGKTTLMRIAFGMTAPDAGRTSVEGTLRRFSSPRDAIAAGVAMVHQHFTIVPTMTVAEHVALGGHGQYDAAAARARVLKVGRATGLVLDPDARAESLTVSAQQRLEIVKALATGARVLILDEPTAVLAPSESAELLRMLRRFADGGGAVVIITHKLHEARDGADVITVLRDGHTVLQSPAAAVSEGDLVEAMLGHARSIPSTSARTSSPAGEMRSVVVDVRDVYLRDERGIERVCGATLRISQGEIVGVAAVEGSGHHELLRALAGIAEPDSGSIARTGSVAFVPEDRHRDALVLDFSLTENVALKGADARSGRIRWRHAERATSDLLTTFDVRASSPRIPARTLSGGNQQKLIIARELADRPALVVAENPTRGLDIAATAAVHERLIAARNDGAAVVLYSSDLDEVLALADRVVVMHAGELREVMIDRDAVGRAMLGA